MEMKSNRSVLLAGLLAALSLGVPVHAQPADLTDASKKVFAEAVSAAKKSDWALCRTKAIGVWQQARVPKVAGLLGICEAELGMSRDAAEHLDFFLTNDDKADPGRTADAQTRFNKVKGLVGEIVVPDGAPEVAVESKIIPVGQRRVFVEPGAHTVTLRRSGFKVAERKLDLKAGERTALDVTLVPEGAGGDSVGAGALGGAGGAGTGGADGTGAAPFGGGGAGAAGAPPLHDEPKPLWPTITLAVIGAAGLGAGVGLTVAGLDATSEYESTPPSCTGDASTCPSELRDAVDQRNGLIGGAIAGYALGGAAIVGMVVYLAIPSASGANSALILRPGLSSFTIAGSF